MKTSWIKKLSYVLILVLLSIISNGQYAIFFAIWIFTAMQLFAFRKLPRWKGLLLTFMVIATGYYTGTDVAPFLPLYMAIIITVIFSLLTTLPYLIDSFFPKHRSSFLSTFIFPTTAVLIEYAYHQVDPFGSWWHVAYTQHSQMLLLQSVSVFGMGYITFLIAWFASVCNWVFEYRNAWGMIRRGVCIYAFVLGLTLIYGGYRVQFQRPDSKTIRVASVSALDSLRIFIDVQGLKNSETSNQVKMETRRKSSALNQDLFKRSIAEAAAGAKIVLWAEGSSIILKEDENGLYAQAGQIASKQNIYLGLGVAVVDPTNSKYLENKFVLFDPTGNKVMDYWKGISVPGAEAPISNNKITGIQKVETAYGTIAGAICFDLDFPQYLKQAKGADILLAPSNDYMEIEQLHSNMAKFRALEQGFNLIRQTGSGLSTGVDYTGKILSEMSDFKTKSKVLITQLPMKGTKTIYSMIGDSFIVFCVFLLMFVIVKIKIPSHKLQWLSKVSREVDTGNCQNP
ncbi:nitrilase-related carbon-nitrogen hydrolase [Robertkochia solimangrovi]|uniref:nitrilase-related carbon-nitrogen hydrolase n=1 Tax=Robertkochia solimangrovi TaxID=2213046 RepID=UPI0011805A79|nr:nitrilase-related carbon-nitrogen hydrolase [Robertkochia solimangrovi]TRZ42275.1 hypothetical protein DMZ48_14700 [Robertkochia solimangrovi]